MNKEILSSRKELFFAYDIKMGNPNGDPDENRPRVLPDGTYYVTDVRLKRFIRDYFKSQGNGILVDTIESKTTNLTGRVAHFLNSINKPEVEEDEILSILLDSFIDARLFGSSFAFKKKAKNDKTVKFDLKTKDSTKEIEWEPVKSLTGALQFNHGEVMHESEAVDIHGTTTFAASEEKGQGTFTSYFALRYALIGFNGVANEHSAKISKMSSHDYEEVIKAMWKSVRGAGNTRTKVGQIPRILISISYKKGIEFQFGNLSDYIKLIPVNNKDEKVWSSPEDYNVDLTLLKERLVKHVDKIESISYEMSPDIKFYKKEKKDKEIPEDWKHLNIDNIK